MVSGTYFVVDCENRGDIQSVVSYLKRSNSSIVITETYWDGTDCGEAYVKFKFPKNKFVSIYNKVEAVFDADINEYLTFDDVKDNIPSLKGTYMDYTSYRQKAKEYFYQVDGKNITLEMFFVVNEENISPNDIIQKAIEAIGNECKILHSSIRKVYSDDILHILFQTNINQLEYGRIAEFGDWCTRKNTWLSSNSVYGQLTINHVFDKYYQIFFDKIANKETLPYKKISGGYYDKPTMVEYDKYMNGTEFNEILIINDREYSIYLK